MRIERLAVKLSLAAVLLVTTVSHAGAQSAWRESYTTGRPLLIFSTPPLAPGGYYEFETTGLSSGADTIMTLVTGLGVPNTILGADGCTRTGGIIESCFTFYMDPAVYPTTRSFAVYVRSFTTATGGTTDLRIQRRGVGGNMGTLAADNCGSPQAWAVGTGCWSRWPNLSFGSLRACRFRYCCVELPYRDDGAAWLSHGACTDLLHCWYVQRYGEQLEDRLHHRPSEPP